MKYVFIFAVLTAISYCLPQDYFGSNESPVEQDISVRPNFFVKYSIPYTIFDQDYTEIVKPFDDVSFILKQYDATNFYDRYSVRSLLTQLDGNQLLTQDEVNYINNLAGILTGDQAADAQERARSLVDLLQSKILGIYNYLRKRFNQTLADSFEDIDRSWLDYELTSNLWKQGMIDLTLMVRRDGGQYTVLQTRPS